MKVHSFWTPEEFRDWIDANLSTDVERKRWRLLSLRVLKGLPVDPDALLTEAVARILGGIRNLNREHPIEANLHETMRSIASSWHKTRKRKPEIRLEDLVNADEGGQDPLEVLTTPEGVQASPEAEMIYRQEMEQILTVFKDREDAQMVVLGRADGLTGAGLAEFAGLDRAQLASVLRLISRRLADYRREA